MLQYIAVGLSDKANSLTSRGVLVVDLMCEPRIYSPANFSSDGFHPSDIGYALMAELSYPALAGRKRERPALELSIPHLAPGF